MKLKLLAMPMQTISRYGIPSNNQNYIVYK